MGGVRIRGDAAREPLPFAGARLAPDAARLRQATAGRSLSPQAVPVDGDWISEALAERQRGRRAQWTEAHVVGRREFVERFAEGLDGRGGYREIARVDGAHVLREREAPYGVDLAAKLTYAAPG